MLDDIELFNLDQRSLLTQDTLTKPQQQMVTQILTWVKNIPETQLRIDTSPLTEMCLKIDSDHVLHSIHYQLCQHFCFIEPIITIMYSLFYILKQTQSDSSLKSAIKEMDETKKALTKFMEIQEHQILAEAFPNFEFSGNTVKHSGKGSSRCFCTEEIYDAAKKEIEEGQNQRVAVRSLPPETKTTIVSAIQQHKNRQKDKETQRRLLVIEKKMSDSKETLQHDEVMLLHSIKAPESVKKQLQNVAITTKSMHLLVKKLIFLQSVQKQLQLAADQTQQKTQQCEKEALEVRTTEPKMMILCALEALTMTYFYLPLIDDDHAKDLKRSYQRLLANILYNSQWLFNVKEEDAHIIREYFHEKYPKKELEQNKPWKIKPGTPLYSEVKLFLKYSFPKEPFCKHLFLNKDRLTYIHSDSKKQTQGLEQTTKTEEIEETGATEETDEEFAVLLRPQLDSRLQHNKSTLVDHLNRMYQGRAIPLYLLQELENIPLLDIDLYEGHQYDLILSLMRSFTLFPDKMKCISQLIENNTQRTAVLPKVILSADLIQLEFYILKALGRQILRIKEIYHIDIDPLSQLMQPDHVKSFDDLKATSIVPSMSRQ